MTIINAPAILLRLLIFKDIIPPSLFYENCGVILLVTPYILIHQV
jgi:hypothetical protein